MSYLYLFANFLITGFIPFTILLVLAWFLLPRFRDSFKKLIVISNTLLLIGATLFLVHNVIEFVQMITKAGGPDYFSFGNPYLKLYWLSFLLPVVFKGLAPQVLWFKNNRNRITTSLTLVPFLLLDELIFIRYAYGNGFLTAAGYKLLNEVKDVKGFVLPALLYMGLVWMVYLVMKRTRR